MESLFVGCFKNFRLVRVSTCMVSGSTILDMNFVGYGVLSTPDVGGQVRYPPNWRGRASNHERDSLLVPRRNTRCSTCWRNFFTTKTTANHSNSHADEAFLSPGVGVREPYAISCRQPSISWSRTALRRAIFVLKISFPWPPKNVIFVSYDGREAKENFEIYTL